MSAKHAAGGSAIFWYEVEDTGILGVGLPSRSASNPVLEVRDAEVRALRGAACGGDRDVVKDAVRNCVALGWGVDWA